MSFSWRELRRTTVAAVAMFPAATLGCRAEAGEAGTLRLALDEPVDGAAPGQIACLLRGDVVVGHGIIA